MHSSKIVNIEISNSDVVSTSLHNADLIGAKLLMKTLNKQCYVKQLLSGQRDNSGYKR